MILEKKNTGINPLTNCGYIKCGGIRTYQNTETNNQKIAELTI